MTDCDVLDNKLLKEINKKLLILVNLAKIQHEQETLDLDCIDCDGKGKVMIEKTCDKCKGVGRFKQ